MINSIKKILKKKFCSAILREKIFFFKHRIQESMIKHDPCFRSVGSFDNLLFSILFFLGANFFSFKSIFPKLIVK